MRQRPGSVWVAGLALLITGGLAFSLLALSSAEVPASGLADDPIIDFKPVYLPAIARNYPNLLPPPLQAGEEGWLRKWPESQDPGQCLQASGTPYYLEREPGAPGWLAAVVETITVTEMELEIHIDDKVAITGRVEYFDPACEFPRLYADHLKVIEVTPDGESAP